MTRTELKQFVARIEGAKAAYESVKNWQETLSPEGVKDAVVSEIAACDKYLKTIEEEVGL